MRKWFAAVLLAALVLTGCGPKQPEAHEAQLFAMDTLMSLRIWGDEALVTQTEDTLRSLEALLSATAEDSDIARLNRDGTAELQPQTADLLQQALDCAARTGGAFDPTVYPLVCLWGFPSGEYHIPTEAELTGALAHTGAQQHARARTVALDAHGVERSVGVLDHGGALVHQNQVVLLADHLLGNGVADLAQTDNDDLHALFSVLPRTARRVISPVSAHLSRARSSFPSERC